jgi:hypothetical protein
MVARTKFGRNAEEIGRTGWKAKVTHSPNNGSRIKRPKVITSPMLRRSKSFFDLIFFQNSRFMLISAVIEE